MSSIIHHEIIGDYYDLIKNVYVFSHMKPFLKDINRELSEYAFIYCVLVIISVLTAAVLFKIVVIFIYFFLIQAITNLVSFCCSLAKAKCKINFCVNFKAGCIYIGKLFKKLYTYNFYAFDNTFAGTVFVISYFLYLIFSIMFVFSIMNQIENEEKTNWFYICHFLTFEFNLLVEIMCVSFYNLRNMKKQFFLSLGYFILLNFLIIVTLLFQRLLINVYGVFEKDEPRRVINLIFNLLFLVMYLTTILKLVKYDVNKEAFKVLLSEKEEFYGENLPLDTDYECNKIDNISKRYKIKGFYYSKDRHNMFKRKDRFEYKLYLIIIFACLAVVNAFEVGYNLFRLVDSVVDIDEVHQYEILNVVKKVTSMLHTSMVIILSWMTFVKMKIRTVIFY